ncbi:MAG: uroporphyrinogen-III C-methyltransferase [Chitinophagaceae bacterium]
MNHQPSKHSPRLTLVGAGPGAVELITLKGIKALLTANVVLYDALANEELLAYAPADSLKIFVGKRKGFKVYSQEEINEMIVHYALHFGHVVRLKGGDPFVFGRGFEEMDFAEKNGVPATVVPGISSSIAVPEMQGIPLTFRGINESYWVTTATLANGALSGDLQLASQSSATVVILMGMHKLAEIVELFEAAGKSETSVAIIQNGTLPEEKIVVAQIHSIQEAVEIQKLSAPAVIIIGEVVKQHPLYLCGQKAFSTPWKSNEK